MAGREQEHTLDLSMSESTFKLTEQFLDDSVEICAVAKIQLHS